MTLFGGMEIGRRALMAHQQALTIVGQNVSNASSRGYTRQTAQLMPVSHLVSTGMGMREIGSGVEIGQVQRLRNDFLDRQYRSEVARFQSWDTLDIAYYEIEGIFSEPGESGLQSQLDLFWDSWQVLANQPELMSARATVIQQGHALIEAFQHVDKQLANMQDNVSDSLSATVAEVNQIAKQLATLNHQIRTVRAAGADGNQLEDRRDLLLDDLAELASIRVTRESNGNLRVSIDGMALVDGDTAHYWTVDQDGQVHWEDFGLPVRPGDGKAAAQMELRDQILQSYRSDLTAIFTDLAGEINLRHEAGFGLDGQTGLPFFDGLAAGRLDAVSVNAALVADPRALAASTSGAEGDGSNALEIYDVRNWKVAANGDSIDGRYFALISRLGSEAREAHRLSENQQLLVTQVNNQRHQLSGVSLDEEMTRMVQYQHGYMAAARLITTIDEMIDTLVNRTGVVGR